MRRAQTSLCGLRNGSFLTPGPCLCYPECQSVRGRVQWYRAAARNHRMIRWPEKLCKSCRAAKHNDRLSRRMAGLTQLLPNHLSDGLGLSAIKCAHQRLFREFGTVLALAAQRRHMSASSPKVAQLISEREFLDSWSVYPEYQ